MTPRRWLILLPPVVALLLRFPLDRYSLYPRCPIFTWLHLQCPGCGATRALAALLHGDLALAFHDNALFVALLPFLLGYLAVCATRAPRANEFHGPHLPRWSVPAALALAGAFTIARNLPH